MAIVCPTYTDIDPLVLDRALDSEDPLAGLACPVDDEYEEIEECCVENLRSLAQRDDYLMCLATEINQKIRNITADDEIAGYNWIFYFSDSTPMRFSNGEYIGN